MRERDARARLLLRAAEREERRGSRRVARVLRRMAAEARAGRLGGARPEDPD